MMQFNEVIEYHQCLLLHGELFESLALVAAQRSREDIYQGKCDKVEAAIFEP